VWCIHNRNKKGEDTNRGFVLEEAMVVAVAAIVGIGEMK
jgi:hypothetical protein